MNLKTYLFGFPLFFLILCEDAEYTDCSAVLCATQTFSIELHDENGNNLIANGEYDFNNIIVNKEGDQTDSNRYSSSENEIIFFLTPISGNNIFEIQLNDTETNILVLNLTVEDRESDCCGPPYTINSARYNDIATEIDRGNSDHPFDDRIVIVK